VTSIFRPAVLLLAGRSVGFLAAFGMPIFLARIFPVSEFGTYKQVFLIYATLFGIAQIGMAESLYYFLPTNRDNGGNHAANTLTVLGASGLVCLALVWVCRSGVGSIFNNPVLPQYLPLAGASLMFSLAAVLLEITMTARKRFRLAAGTYAVSEILRVGFYLLPVAIFGGLEALLWGAVAFALLRLGVTVFYLYRNFGTGLRPDWQVLRGQLAYALPFAMAVTIDVAQGTLHLYAVAHFFPPAMFAVYAVGCLQIPLVDMMMTSTGNVMMVRMQELRTAGRTADILEIWRDTTLKLALVFVPLVVALLILADHLITLLYTSRYAASVPVFMVSVTMIAMAGIMTDSVLRVYAQTRYLVVLNIVRLGVVATTIVFLMRALDITGAVVATVLATIIYKALALLRIKHVLKCPLSRILPWGGVARVLAITAVAALPAILVKLLLERAGLAPVVILLVPGMVYAIAYIALFYLYAPISKADKAALALWVYKPFATVIRGLKAF